MTLGEFITYCTLKDLIVTHERLDYEWHANVANKQQLVVENDNFLATITYTYLAGKYSILYSRLTKVTIPRDEDLDQADLGTIVSKFA